jgi:hypothetical protein
MKTLKIFRSKYVLLAMMTLIALPSFARINVRPTSDNGASNGSDSWTLLGRSVVIPLSANGKSVKATRQIICPNQDQLNGSCTSGDYVFLFQIQSTSANVNVNIGKLQGFVKVDGDDSGTYGVMLCSDFNDQELCTTNPNDPNLTHISAITFTTKGKKITAVTFTVPSFFNFPAGSTPQEGQGLTFYIQIHLNTALPLIYPTLGIN